MNRILNTNIIIKIFLFLSCLLIIFLLNSSNQIASATSGCTLGGSGINISVSNYVTSDIILSDGCAVRGGICGGTGYMIEAHCSNYESHMQSIRNLAAAYKSAYDSGTLYNGMQVMSYSETIIQTGVPFPVQTIAVKLASANANYSIEHYKQKADGSGYEKEAGMTGSGNATVGTGIDAWTSATERGDLK